jgi:hypothetical protein
MYNSTLCLYVQTYIFVSLQDNRLIHVGSYVRNIGKCLYVHHTAYTIYEYYSTSFSYIRKPILHDSIRYFVDRMWMDIFLLFIVVDVYAYFCLRAHNNYHHLFSFSNSSLFCSTINNLHYLFNNHFALRSDFLSLALSAVLSSPPSVLSLAVLSSPPSVLSLAVLSSPPLVSLSAVLCHRHQCFISVDSICRLPDRYPASR